MAEPKVIKKENGELCHPCIGAVIIKNNQILMLDREKPPFGWACIAGHIDEGETSLKALIREIKEESGMEMKSCYLLFEEEINNPCRRGVNWHYWYVYKCDVKGEIVIEKEEAKDIRWVYLDKLNKLKLEPVWECILKKIELL
jgi:ADP-ribose pyrophosphatase YjhB (NUDIX family)